MERVSLEGASGLSPLSMGIQVFREGSWGVLIIQHQKISISKAGSAISYSTLEAFTVAVSCCCRGDRE